MQLVLLVVALFPSNYSTTMAYFKSAFLFCAVAAVLITSSTVYSFETNSTCDSFVAYSDCSAHLHCEWCGPTDAFFPTSACYERGAGLTCCEVKNTSNANCNSNVQICSAAETCYHEKIDLGMGADCVMPVCCGGATPDPCYPGCMPSGGKCCGEAMPCTSEQYCCGSPDSSLACCEIGSACCQVPDGSAHWCCPTEKQCNMNGGCDAL